MVLSLVMPVSALDGQVQAERREGYDVAAIHYTDGESNERAIPFTETASDYADTLPEGVTKEQVTVEYFSTTRWDGAVDLSWYNGTDTEFTLTTPAAGGCGRAGEQQYHRLRRQDHPPGGGHLPAAV